MANGDLSAAIPGEVDDLSQDLLERLPKVGAMHGLLGGRGLSFSEAVGRLIICHRAGVDIEKQPVDDDDLDSRVAQLHGQLVSSFSQATTKQEVDSKLHEFRTKLWHDVPTSVQSAINGVRARRRPLPQLANVRDALQHISRSDAISMAFKRVRGKHDKRAARNCRSGSPKVGTGDL